MKLSKLIFKGAKLAPQGFNDLCDEQGRTCAYGAAFHALTGEKPTLGYNAGLDYYRVEKAVNIHNLFATNPITEARQSVGGIIVDLNDKYRWTRERIAAWLRCQGL